MLQLHGEGDMEGAHLLPWQPLHIGRVAALDICADTREVGRTCSQHCLHECTSSFSACE